MTGEAVYGAHRQAVVAAEHDRAGAGPGDGMGALAEKARPGRDRGEVAGLVVRERRVGGDRRRRREVPLILDLMTELAKALHQPGRPQGRRSHDGAGLARAEIDGRAEEGETLSAAWRGRVAR